MDNSILLVVAGAAVMPAALMLRWIVGGRGCPRRARFGGAVRGLWRVWVLDGDRPMSMHSCWSPTKADDYANRLREYWPEYRVSVQGPGRWRRELTGGERR
jgi:hypothetical protein